MRHHRVAPFLGSALICVVGFMLTATNVQAQFTNETALVKDGVRFLLLPSATISQADNGTVRVTLTNLSSRIDRTSGVEVDGKRYDYLAFNGQLVPFFNDIRVNTLALAFTFDGAGSCNRVSYASWRVGGSENVLVCARTGTPSLTGYQISGITTAGVLELQSKVRSLVAAETRAAQQRASQEAAQEAAAQAARTATVTSAPASKTSTPTAGTARSTPATATTSAPAPTTAAEAERASQQAEANRQAAAAQATLDQLARDNAAAQQRLDAATDELAGSVVAVAQILAQNSRDKAAREARQAAANAAYYQRKVAENAARISARYAANLNGRTCSASDLAVARIGTVLTDSLTMRTCRTSDGRAMAWVQVVNTTPRHVRVSATGASEFGLLAIAHAPVSEWNTGSTAGKAQTTDFFLPPGAPAHRMMIWTNERGEIGQYSVHPREWTVSAVDDAVWFTGLDVSSSANTVGGYEESLFGLRFDGGLHIGNRVLIGGHVGLDGENYNFGFNAHYILGNDNQRFRPYVRLDPWTAVYGTTTYGFSNDVGYQGFVYGFGAGVLFFPSLSENSIAISLEWGTTSGSMFDDNANDQAYSQSGFRLGYRAFGFGGPR